MGEGTGSKSLKERLEEFGLLKALRHRRSRRFGLGMRMPAGPLAFESRHKAIPLTEEEEGALVFAAAGITGHALADLCYARDGGGNIMGGLAARTIASGDGLQTVALAVINDKGSWLIKRPRELAAGGIQEMVELGRHGKFTELYRKLRVKITDTRPATPREPLFNINANRWSAHSEGTSYFLPINDLTLMYVNGLLEILNEQTGAFLLDDRNNYQPAGLAGFAASRGGHLQNDPAKGRVATVRQVEQFVTEFVTVEQGMMLQNLGLMAQALGLGGFPNFANHEFGWFQALGFRMSEMEASGYLGAGKLATMGMKLLNKDPKIPFPVGLERGGEVLLKPFCPPYYPTMREAVEAVVDLKFGAHGIFREANAMSAWINHGETCKQIEGISKPGIEATVAYCEYLLKRYGRFPVYMPSYRTVLGFQACHLDREFYDRYYHPDALAPEQREDFARQTE